MKFIQYYIHTSNAKTAKVYTELVYTHFHLNIW